MLASANNFNTHYCAKCGFSDLKTGNLICNGSHTIKLYSPIEEFTIDDLNILLYCQSCGPNYESNQQCSSHVPMNQLTIDFNQSSSKQLSLSKQLYNHYRAYHLAGSGTLKAGTTKDTPYRLLRFRHLPASEGKYQQLIHTYKTFSFIGPPPPEVNAVSSSVPVEEDMDGIIDSNISETIEESQVHTSVELKASVTAVDIGNSLIQILTQQEIQSLDDTSAEKTDRSPARCAKHRHSGA